ncbi:MAG: methyltransferase domain-containing protein [Thermoflexales bacterium]|nr:methyltransferase domain-containing protein [Thermoflexales bacterium]
MAQASTRQCGSVGDFEREWAEALACGGGRWLVCPTDSPSTQAKLDEQIKAAQVRDVLHAAGLTQGLALECGCGAAGMSVYMADLGFRSVACDISMNALRLARLNAACHLNQQSIERFSMARGNVFTLPFGDASFDLVASYGLLEHFAPGVLDQVLGEMLRVVRPGGMVIADIVPGCFSVRTLGMWVNLLGSLAAHALTLRWRRLPALPAAYLDSLYENELEAEAWAEALRGAGLRDVQVRVNRPFPPLALSGWPERLYVRLLQRVRPLWEWFDRAQPGWGRRWGWMYLAWGTKP